MWIRIIRGGVIIILTMSLQVHAGNSNVDFKTKNLSPVTPSSSIEPKLEITNMSASDDLFPSQTCWGDKFDIIVSGITGDLEPSCWDDSLILLVFQIIEEDGGLVDPDDEVREKQTVFETHFQAYGVPYVDTLKDVPLYDWCDEWDWTGEFHVQILSLCLTSIYVSPTEDVTLIFYPSAVTLTGPANGAEAQYNSTTLHWDGIRNASSYQIQLDNTNTFTSPLIDDVTGAISYTLPELDIDSTYFWRVRAHNNTCGDGNWSATRQFIARFEVGIDDDRPPTLPLDFALEQNHPNPFNAGTNIEFSVPRVSHVTLSIYNSSGEKIRTLVDGPLAAGYKAVYWDGKNQDGEMVASGVYVYRLVAGNDQASRKMLLLK